MVLIEFLNCHTWSSWSELLCILPCLGCINYKIHTAHMKEVRLCPFLVTTHTIIWGPCPNSNYHTHISDHIWESPPYGIFSENWVWYIMIDKLYHRANPRSSLRPIACFAEELQYFICDRVTLPMIKKYGLNALLCTRMASPYTMHIPKVN